MAGERAGATAAAARLVNRNLPPALATGGGPSWEVPGHATARQRRVSFRLPRASARAPNPEASSAQLSDCINAKRLIRRPRHHGSSFWRLAAGRTSGSAMSAAVAALRFAARDFGSRFRSCSFLPSTFIHRDDARSFMVDQAEANTIKPSSSAEHILVDRRIGEEVDKRVRDDTENADFHFVPESLKRAIRGPEPHRDPAIQSQPERLTDFRAKHAERCSGVNAGRQPDLLRANSKHDRQHNAFILARVVVDMREVKLVHVATSRRMVRQSPLGLVQRRAPGRQRPWPPHLHLPVSSHARRGESRPERPTRQHRGPHPWRATATLRAVR